MRKELPQIVAAGVALAAVLAYLNAQQLEPDTGAGAGAGSGEDYRAWLNEPDRDGDGVPDAREAGRGTDPDRSDSDGDGIGDGDTFARLEAELAPGPIGIEYVELADGEGEETLRWKPLHRVAREGTFVKMARDVVEGRSHRLEAMAIDGDHRAYRMRGWLTAPQTDTYSFWLSSDDEGEFWLSTDASPFNRRRICESLRWTRAYDWGNFGPEQSAGVDLIAGQKYYFEVRWTQLLKDSHAAVAWAVGGGRPAVVGARFIEPYEVSADDADDNGLPDAWESEHELAGGVAESDSDGDGLSDFEEYQLGADPNTADSQGRDGIATWEVWEGLYGAYVFDMTSTGRVYPRKPGRVGYLRELEAPPFYGENYGSRIRGRLKIPEDGFYTFWISSDDHSEFWLSQDGSSLGRRRIARVVGNTGWREFFSFPEQRSSPQFMRAGAVRYFEVLHKESRGADHVSVAWSRSDTFNPEGIPVPAVIGGEHLVSWEPEEGDADDNGLPDAWEAEMDLPAGATAHIDSDGDGVSNWREYLSGRDPVERDNADPKQSLLCETWYEVPGARTRAFCLGASFPARPDETTQISEVNYARRGENYACRLRGYIVPPVDGDYRFSVSGDDEVELWLSPSGNKFSKRKYASVNSRVGWRKWGRSSAQASPAIPLSGGQKCYFEVIHKQADRGGHLAVAWDIPGRQAEAIILSEYLRPYAPVAGDADDDDLPDAWEAQVGLSPQVASADHGAWGDPDGDLLDNLREFQLGTDPLVADAAGRRGLVLWESWEDLGNEYIDDLVYSQKFPQAPDERAWLGELRSPPDRGDNYGSRMRALLVAPETGNYTFWVSGNNQVRLYLGTGEEKFSKRLIAEVPEHTPELVWDKYGLQQSAPVALAAGGQYFIEVLQKEGLYDDHVAVSWETPGGGGREIVGGGHVVAFDRDPDDLDDDDLPDSWEIANGLDPLSSRVSDGALGDADGDGLSNREEFLAGTSASNADTDGDGLSDGDEFRSLGTDPLVADTGILQQESTIAGGLFSGGQGFDSIAGEVAILSGRQGELAYGFQTDSAGARIIQISTTIFGGRTRGVRVPAILRVNGIVLADGFISGWGGRAADFSVLSQHLEAGAHSLELELFVDDSSLAIQVDAVAVLELTGADADANGTADWLDAKRSRENSLLTRSGASRVSPACIEGLARFPGLVSVGGVEVQRGVEGHWYLDVPLAAGGAATGVVASMDNGTVTRSLQITWAVTDVLAGGKLDVRTGDSLRLSAGDAGSITISGAGGDRGLRARPGGILAFQFDTPGIYQVTGGTAARPVGEVLTVHVHRADFGDPLFLYRDLARLWETPGISDRLAIEPDLRLEFSEAGQPGEVARVFRALSRSSGTRHVLARLPSAPGGGRGPIAARGTIETHRLVADSQRDHRVVIAGTLEDGSQIVRLQLIADALPPGGYIEIRIQVAGVTFLDGTTIKQIRAGDLAADGTVAIDMIRPAGTETSVCHTIHVFDAAGELVGH